MNSETINYPNQNMTPEQAFSQDTLNRLTATLLGWRQSPGTVGALLLHSCWGESSVLTRRYQGQTIAASAGLVGGSITLFDKTGEKSWKRFARSVVENLLFLQSPDGGFWHASNEFEPTYTCYQTCPIQQALPILALLKYAAWSHADADTREAIIPAVQRFWKWQETAWWQKGTPWRGRLKAGWCGVTNQDLCVVAAMARYGKLTGDWSQYEKFGRPALDYFLSPEIYYPEIGLFERNDQANFAERTSYNDIIIPMLGTIRDETGDNSFQAVIDNASAHLFDAICEDDQGNIQIAWGVKTDPADKSRIEGWIKHPFVIPGYPGLIRIMSTYLSRHPDTARAKQLEGLTKTLAKYVFSDGSLPVSSGAKDPMFSVVPASPGGFWNYLINYLGDSVQAPMHTRVPVIKRVCGDMSYTSSEFLWEIQRDGSRLFAGFKPDASAMIIGPDEKLSGIDFAELAQPEIIESVTSPNS